MSDFKLPNAVTLFSQEKTTIASLWTVYVAATFAAAGYGLSGTLGPFTASAVTLGFSAFAIGNWSLLNQSLVINLKLQKDIKNVIASEGDNQFKCSIGALVERANPPYISLAIHLFIDACVIAALWSRVAPIGKLLGI